MGLSKRLKPLRTLAWYLGRPRHWPQLYWEAERLRHWGRRRRAEAHEAGAAWCAERAVSVEEALRRVTGTDAGPSWRQAHPQEMAEAERRAAACPVAMGGGAALDLLYGLAQHVQALTVVETGVALGWSSLVLLLSLGQRGGRLYSVDLPYPQAGSERYVGWVVPEGLRGGWRIWRYADRQGLPKALRAAGAVDMCHYDSDKRPTGRAWAYARLWAALRPGGVFISDDVGDNLAFRDFAGLVRVKPVVAAADERYVGILVKKACGG